MALNKKQALDDYDYLYKTIETYMVNEDWLVNVIHSGIMDRREDISILDIIIGTIEDMVVDGVQDEDYKEFLSTDKRALRILKRYGFEHYIKE